MEAADWAKQLPAPNLSATSQKIRNLSNMWRPEPRSCPEQIRHSAESLRNKSKQNKQTRKSQSVSHLWNGWDVSSVRQKDPNSGYLMEKLFFLWISGFPWCLQLSYFCTLVLCLIFLWNSVWNFYWETIKSSLALKFLSVRVSKGIRFLLGIILRKIW